LSLAVRNTKELIQPEKFRLKVLVYGLPGTGKTSWMSTAPGLGVAACETGQGKGLLTVAQKGFDFVEPTNLMEFESICAGRVFGDKQTIGLDSLTSMSNTFIKDAALSIPRTRGASEKRNKGVPELDDYGVMAELTRKLLAKLLENDKHVIVTATERYKGPDLESGVGETLIGPDLPGQMFLGSTAMFDFVLRLRTRQKLRDPKDPKSRYVERYFVTQPDGQGTLAKCRSTMDNKPLLDKEEVFDPETGQGTFDALLKKILAGYAASAAKAAAAVSV
jgi:hypothetical protein